MTKSACRNARSRASPFVIGCFVIPSTLGVSDFGFLSTLGVLDFGIPSTLGVSDFVILTSAGGCGSHHLRDVPVGNQSHAIVFIVDDARGTVLSRRDVIRMLYANLSAIAQMDFQRLKRDAIHQFDHQGRIHGDASHH
jgi:hypothetical protein